MIESFAALLAAHLLADFLLQDRAMVQHKRRPRVFARHIAIVAATTWLALASIAPAAIAAVLVVAATHAAMDWAKLRWLGPGLWAFAFDQAVHLSVIAILAAAVPALWAASAWGQLAPAEAAAAHRAMILLAAALLAVRVGGILIGRAIDELGWTNEAQAESLPGAGAAIGHLERALILLFVLTGQSAGVALLLAAKSLLRMRDEDRRHSEYVIAGSLMSFGWALGVALLTRHALGLEGLEGVGAAPAPASACVQCPGLTGGR